MLSKQERRDLVTKLQTARQELIKTIQSLAEEELAQRKQEGDRTRKGMLFHLADAEHHYVFGWAKRARDEDNPDLSPLVSSSELAQAPLYDEALKLSTQELMDRLHKAREDTLAFLAETGDDEFERIGRNTPFGDLSVHQFLKSLYRHDQMHIAEMSGQDSRYDIRTTSGQKL